MADILQPYMYNADPNLLRTGGLTPDYYNKYYAAQYTGQPVNAPIGSGVPIPTTPDVPSVIVPPTTPTAPVVAPVPTAPIDPNAAPVVLSEAQRQARDRARMQAQQFFVERGLDPNNYNELIEQRLNQLTSTFTPTTDPTTAFTDNIGDSIYSGETARIRNLLSGQAEEKFGTNYGNKVIGSSLLDDAINSILGTQRKDAETFLERGKKRGMYNDVGYDAGRAALEESAGTARSRLQSTAGSIIDKYRAQANSVRDRAQDIIGRAQSQGAGELRSVIGNTNFFDTQNIQNKIGARQGAVNLRDADVATALAERKRLSSQGRGLGSQGAF
jgi:hypothetical protein